MAKWPEGSILFGARGHTAVDFPWIKTKTILSMILTIISVVIFIASLQPYVAFFTFVLLIIKGALLLKRP